MTVCLMDSITYTGYRNGSDDMVKEARKHAVERYIEEAKTRGFVIIGHPYALAQPSLFDNTQLDIIVRALIR